MKVVVARDKDDDGAGRLGGTLGAYACLGDVFDDAGEEHTFHGVAYRAFKDNFELHLVAFHQTACVGHDAGGPGFDKSLEDAPAFVLVRDLAFNGLVHLFAEGGHGQHDTACEEGTCIECEFGGASGAACSVGGDGTFHS